MMKDLPEAGEGFLGLYKGETKITRGPGQETEPEVGGGGKSSVQPRNVAVQSVQLIAQSRESAIDGSAHGGGHGFC
jgi:hypothetical protein